MNILPNGNAIIYSEGAFNTTNGKTAHGLVRFTERYNVHSVIDSKYEGQDAGKVLDKKENGIPIFASIEDAIKFSQDKGEPATHFVIGLAPDGGRLDPDARVDVLKAIGFGLHLDSGLHDFLSDDPEIVDLAFQAGVKIRDVRKPVSRDELHFFTGKIERVNCLKIAVLGTDSAVGKRTTAWVVVHALRNAGFKTEMIGTGQTAWLQGAKYSIIMDSLINDFVSGEIENAVFSAWEESNPDVIVIEGQGSLMNPAYPGGFEILAAGRPDIIILQHAPARKEYDGFPGYFIQSLEKQIKIIEMLSGKPVAAVTVNHENIPYEKIPSVCEQIEKETGLPAVDVLVQGAEKLLGVIKNHLNIR
ncbi:MAG: DUF1611 domain-containing protein [Melioribacteraceae bacterium]|nr:DUF1611 domain-containing protein [Melioribacteraceae bacterium]MCF8354988.1 DUF1611 domain-containing protein [Melioribacteraceae bacterium]MCF8394313.1 DUF1611 domain-containing protein [Melioribacteraceae bacterium]MCF8419992.1 DUF1611 domain-containing protein [Melioribacteraceae bacterium]